MAAGRHLQKLAVLFLLKTLTITLALTISFKMPMSAKAIIYNESGADYTVWIGRKDCKNLTGYWNDDTFSVFVERQCIRIFEHSGCQGDMRSLCASKDEYNFHEMDFKNKLSSVGPCTSSEILSCEQETQDK